MVKSTTRESTLHKLTLPNNKKILAISSFGATVYLQIYGDDCEIISPEIMKRVIPYEYNLSVNKK